MQFFDTHAHLSDDLLWDLREQVSSNMQACGVLEATIINTCRQDLERSLELTRRPEGPKFYFAAATGPNEVQAQGELFFPLVVQAAQAGRLIAIGETGLDYHWQTSPVELQKAWFIRYLELALHLELPVIIHCRKALDDIIEILKAHYVGKKGCRGGVFHCFCEDWPSACKVLDLGFLISFSGIVTYKSAVDTQEVATKIDERCYVVETDSPYLYPGKERSKLNEPANVLLVAEKIAALRGESLSQVAAISVANARRLFQLE